MSDNFPRSYENRFQKGQCERPRCSITSVPFCSLDKFLAGGYDKPLSFRTEALKFWHDANKDVLEHVQVLDLEIVNLDTPEGQKIHTDVNKAAVDGGYEGILIKDPDASYECKRLTAWSQTKTHLLK